MSPGISLEGTLLYRDLETGVYELHTADAVYEVSSVPETWNKLFPKLVNKQVKVHGFFETKLTLFNTGKRLFFVQEISHAGESTP